MRRRMSGTLLVLPLFLGLAVAGCAGSGSDGEGVATAGGGAAGPSPSASAVALSDEDRGREFAKCMRENGIDMPDPEPGGGLRMRKAPGGDEEKMQAAMEKCRSLLPNGGTGMKLDPEQVEKVRQLARCMRENGVPNFPDPAADGSIDLKTVDNLDLDDPNVRAAMEKCRQGGPLIMRKSK
ncbi:hypothetical protein [Plantactinospora sp. CA-290183]|uniref:hypothetical protein n=1 Tax=Plantactinospora sp. CA-290183 TaxID=3240006 RepID=UPI003D9248F9